VALGDFCLVLKVSSTFCVANTALWFLRFKRLGQVAFISPFLPFLEIATCTLVLWGVLVGPVVLCVFHSAQYLFGPGHAEHLAVWVSFYEIPPDWFPPPPGSTVAPPHPLAAVDIFFPDVLRFFSRLFPFGLLITFLFSDSWIFPTPFTLCLCSLLIWLFFLWVFHVARSVVVFSLLFMCSRGLLSACACSPAAF